MYFLLLHISEKCSWSFRGDIKAEMLDAVVDSILLMYTACGLALWVIDITVVLSVSILPPSLKLALSVYLNA